MITLRLAVADINVIYDALKFIKEDAEKNGHATVELFEKVMVFIKEASEQDISTWDGYVTNEVNSVLEALLPEAESGNIGISYDKPILEQYETGPIYDESKANGVSINIVLKFPEAIAIK